MSDAGANTSSNWLPVISAAVTLISTSVGFISSQLMERSKDRHAYEREKEARESARRDNLFERRTEFQRQTLLDLQDAVMKLIRATGEMYHIDLMASRATGKWVKQLFPDELDNRAFSAGVQITVLGVRVRDKSIRDLLAQLKVHTDGVVFAKNQAEAEGSLGKMSDSFAALNARIGEVLRSLDDGDMSN